VSGTCLPAGRFVKQMLRFSPGLGHSMLAYVIINVPKSKKAKMYQNFKKEKCTGTK